MTKQEIAEIIHTITPRKQLLWDLEQAERANGKAQGIAGYKTVQEELRLHGGERVADITLGAIPKKKAREQKSGQVVETQETPRTRHKPQKSGAGRRERSAEARRTRLSAILEDVRIRESEEKIIPSRGSETENEEEIEESGGTDTSEQSSKEEKGQQGTRVTEESRENWTGEQGREASEQIEENKGRTAREKQQIQRTTKGDQLIWKTTKRKITAKVTQLSASSRQGKTKA